MKKPLQLMSLIALLMLFATSTVQAQTWTENGTYKISVPGQDLFMTINIGTGALEWAAELPGDDPKQVWTITDHRTPASAGLMEIWAVIPGAGTFTMTTNGVAEDHPNYTITVRAGEPVSVEPLAEDYSGLDQFQRRKTNPAPAVGNNALFLRTPWGTNSRFGVIPSAAGDPVQFDGGGIDELVFTFVAGLPTAIGDAEISSNGIYPNPSNNGIFNLKETTEWTVYGLTGAVVAKGNGTLVDLASSPKGVYIIKFDGLTQKIMF